MAPARDRRPTIRGDLHVHSSHSRCDHPAGSLYTDGTACGRTAIEEMAQLAAASGMEYFALVNHASDPARPHHADAVTNAKILHHLTEILQLNRRLGRGRARILAGIEASLLPDGTLDVDHTILSHLDLVIVSRHGGPVQLPARIVHAFRKAMENPHVDIIGHPTRSLDRLSLKDWETIVRQAVRTDTAIEFNLRVPFSRPLAQLVAIEGARVALGSDTHRETASEHRLVTAKDPAADELLGNLLASGVRPKQILNLKPFEQLTAWLTERVRATVR